MKHFLCVLAIVAAAMSDSKFESILKTSNDRFSANMLQQVVNSQKNKSCVLSAFSVLSPLAQLALASVGESHDEILKAIGLPNDNVTKEVFSELNANLRSLKNIHLEFANKIYVSEEFTLNDTFAATEKKIFNSAIENIDFQNETEAAAKINAWVEAHTHKRIKHLVNPDSFDEGTAAVLVNSIYFKGHWKKPFERYSTVNRTFHVTKNLSNPLPMMHQSEYFKYAEDAELDAKFLEMEYDGDEASFVVALPNKIDGIDTLIEKFKDPSNLNKAFKSMSSKKVKVYLPRFKIETTTNLKSVLKKMNITKLFDAKQAKLYNVLKEMKDLYVSEAAQKAFIDVNEEGVEATVVNDFILEFKMGAYVMEEKEFNADHPFLFFILEKNNILFSGVFRS